MLLCLNRCRATRGRVDTEEETLKTHPASGAPVESGVQIATLKKREKRSATMETPGNSPGRTAEAQRRSVLGASPRCNEGHENRLAPNSAMRAVARRESAGQPLGAPFRTEPPVAVSFDSSSSPYSTLGLPVNFLPKETAWPIRLSAVFCPFPTRRALV
jgi:hypothetical protein